MVTQPASHEGGVVLNGLSFVQSVKHIFIICYSAKEKEKPDKGNAVKL